MRYTDITRHKQQVEALESLRESEEKFRILAEKSLAGIFLHAKGRRQYVNPRFANIFGYTAAELTGPVTSREIVHPDDWPMVRENIRKLLEGEEPNMHYTFRGRTKQGETIYAEVYGSRLTYHDEPAILGTVLNITEQWRLRQEVLEVQESERRRIGQDLHDGVASQLSGISMMIQGIINDIENSRSADINDIRKVGHLIIESTKDVRRLAHGLNPVKLNKGGLEAALQHLAENTARRNGLDCYYHGDEQVPDLPNETTMHLYWIAKEAVNNVLKHAEADHIWIQLSANNKRLELTVRDDGQGFPTESEKIDGLGLHTMHYRADLIGGLLTIAPASGDGTIVQCTCRVSSRPFSA